MGQQDDGGPGFRADALLVRARRVAGLSQRELAAVVGIPPSTLASIESGARRPGVELLDRLLRASGLRLAVVDADGAELAPFPDNTIRDNAGRRFPAHLEVLPPHRIPPKRVASPRYDRGPARGWYHLRTGAAGNEFDAAGTDHPTDAEVEFARQKTLFGRSPSWPRRAAAIREVWGTPAERDSD
jgi:transcriptional regulator with XRE-family HTH domain